MSVLQKEEMVDLGTMFSYLHGIVESLQKITRWDVRNRIGGQTVTENDLQHTLKTVLFTLFCGILENSRRVGEEKLDMERLVVAALLHDLGEIKPGDIALFQKKREDSIAEYKAFEEVIAPLPEVVRAYMVDTYRHAVTGARFSVNSREARFFKAVEVLGYMKRGLHECRNGNVHFAPNNFDRHVPEIEGAAKEFPTLLHHIEPMRAEMEEHCAAFRKRREEYLANFVRNGNPSEKFPF